MLVDPMEAIMKTTRLLVPTSTSGVVDPGPIPTVVPDPLDLQQASESGTRTLWVVFTIMTVSSIGFAGLSWSVPIGKRIYHVVTTLITVTAAISYFAMATGHATAFHHERVEHQHDHGLPPTYTDVARQVLWARYVDWALTTPLLLLDLSLLAGLSGGHTLIAIVADVIMVLTGLFAAFGDENTAQKWGWYTIACIAYLVIIWHLAVNGRSGAVARGGKVGAFYSSIAGFTLIIWTIYPIIWGIADGARIVSVDTEIISYAVLDVLAKPIFGAWLLITHANLPETNIELTGYWAQGLATEGTLRLRDDDGA